MDMGAQIGLGMAMFTAIILGMVAVLVLARKWLVSTGDVSIVINGDGETALHVEAGSTLLNALSAQKIFIPSACGSTGTCGSAANYTLCWKASRGWGFCS